jgi:hypothetical protein
MKKISIKNLSGQVTIPLYSFAFLAHLLPQGTPEMFSHATLCVAFYLFPDNIHELRANFYGTSIFASRGRASTVKKICGIHWQNRRTRKANRRVAYKVKNCPALSFIQKIWLSGK